MRFTAFVNREAAAAGGPWGELLPAVTVPVNARNRVQWVLGEQTLLPPLAMRAGVDLVHSLASTAPLWGRFRRVVTVHDLIYARFPEAHAGIRDKGMKVLVPQAVRRSHRVIADSQSTRDDLVEMLGIRDDRIDVVPLGLGGVQRAAPLPEQEVRARFDLGERRVLLSLSAKRPHKNLLALIGALARIPAEERPVLVLPGYPHRARGRAARARGERGCCRRRALPGLGLRRGARGSVGARGGVRVSLPVRGLRTARARGDGAGSSGRVLERLLLTRGRGRGGAAVRPARRVGDRQCARALCRTKRCASTCAPAVWPGWPSSPGSAPRVSRSRATAVRSSDRHSGTPESYRRAGLRRTRLGSYALPQLRAFRRA